MLTISNGLFRMFKTRGICVVDDGKWKHPCRSLVVKVQSCEKLCIFTPYQGTVFWHLEIQMSCKAFFSGKIILNNMKIGKMFN